MFSQELPPCPESKFLPEDLGIVADIDWEGRVEEYLADSPCVWISIAQLKQFQPDPIQTGLAALLFQFHAQYRLLTARRTQSDQRRSEYFGMGIEYTLHRDGVEGVLRRDDPMGFAAAEPDPAALVQIAHISHAVPDAAGRIGYFCHSGRFVTIKIGAAYLRAAYGDFTDCTGGKRQAAAPLADGRIADRD